LSTILDRPEPLHLFEVLGLERPMDARNLSFQHLLNANLVRTNTRKKNFSGSNFDITPEPTSAGSLYQSYGQTGNRLLLHIDCEVL
jgi:hypothetical protein